MKDYIVFFTKGFDQYTIDKQKKVFPEAYVSCIDSNADYNKLIEESKKAKSKNFSNFYILWDKNDIPDMNSEMKSEFKKVFKEVGAIPYKYNKLLEGYENNTAPTAGAAPTGAAQGGTPVGGTPTGNAPVTSAPAGNTADVNVVQGTLDPNSINAASNYGAVYSKNHTATVFIWPFNVFIADSFMSNAIKAFADAVRMDTESRSNDASVHSTVYRPRKGDWQRIIYIPQSIPDLYQNVARGDTMFQFINEKLANYPFAEHTLSKLYRQHMTNGTLSVGGAKIEYGNLNEADIIAACKKAGATNANIKNIHIFYTKPYEKYITQWCPKERCTAIGTVDMPNVRKNKEQIDIFDQTKKQISEWLNDESWRKALQLIYKCPDNDERVSDSTREAHDLLILMIEHLSNYKAFWDYWNNYLSQKDVFGRPDGGGTPGSSSDSAVKDFIQTINDVSGNESSAMEKIYKSAGWIPKDMSQSEWGLFGTKAALNKFGKDYEKFKTVTTELPSQAKEAADEVKQTAAETADKINSKFGDKKPSNPENNTNDKPAIKAVSFDELEPSTIKGDGDEDKGKSKKQESLMYEEVTAPVSQPTNAEPATGNTENAPANAAPKEELPDLPEEMDPVMLNQIACQLTSLFCPEQVGKTPYVGHNFFSDDVWRDLEGLRVKDKYTGRYMKSKTAIDGFTPDRVRKIRDEIDRLRGPYQAKGDAEDGKTPEGSSVPSNVIKPDGDEGGKAGISDMSDTTISNVSH